MNFIIGLPNVQGRYCIYMVVDRLTKISHLFSIPSDYTTTHLAKLFFREVFRLHGLPKTIISDRDNIFIGSFWQEIFRMVGTDLTPSISYHPQIDGKTKIVKNGLRDI
jgi:hypothetical protein